MNILEKTILLQLLANSLFYFFRDQNNEQFYLNDFEETTDDFDAILHPVPVPDYSAGFCRGFRIEIVFADDQPRCGFLTSNCAVESYKKDNHMFVTIYDALNAYLQWRMSINND